MADVGQWVPEFEGQRPPFEAGNSVGRQFEPGHELMVSTHGAYSPRKVDPLAAELVDQVLADPGMPAHVKAPAYALELWTLARATAQIQLVSEWLAEQGERVDRKGRRPPGVIPGIGDPGDERVRSALLVLHRAETRAASARSRLGLTPTSAARLGRNVMQGAAAQADVALRMAQLHELERQGWKPPPGWPGVDGATGDDDEGGDDDG